MYFLRFMSGLLALFFLWADATAGNTAPAPDLKLVSVVMLMRHGIRSPTKQPAMALGVAANDWPLWRTAPGELTAHGAHAVTLLGAFERVYFADAGLIPSSCPPSGLIDIVADSDERTVATAQALIKGLAPGCGIRAAHLAQGVDDPIFSALSIHAADFDAEAARQAALDHIGGNLDQFVARYQENLNHMQEILCPTPTSAKACGILHETSLLSAQHGEMKLKGPIAAASTASEIFLLEYLEGKSLKDVGWGRVTPHDMLQLLALHPAKYPVTAYPAYIADRAATPIAQSIRAGLSGDQPAKLTILVGHDTNIADLAGMLDLHWTLGGYPDRDPPPGGALMFESLQDRATGQRFVRLLYIVQTPEQMRDLVPLSAEHPPAMAVLNIPACPAVHGYCPLNKFDELVRAKLVPAYELTSH